MASNLQLSGLASGFDWKSLVEQLMQVERAPIDRLAAEKTRNSSKVSALGNLATRLTALQTSATVLGADGAFGLRTATVSATGVGWSAAASAATASGSYTIAVSQLATPARREGATNIGTSLSPTTDVSGTTIANLPIGNPITAGTFTVNGKAVTVALTDSLDTVFTAISTATGGAVTAAYNPGTDRITLSGAGEIVLGAANDTSNFLRSLKLANNGTGTVTSSGQLGTVKTTATLANANLGTPITAVDGTGAGTFSINGVTFNYNVNTDTLAGLVAQINQSTAGVTATYDPTNDRMTITNDTTGDVGVALDEAAGGLLGALGLTTGGALVRGRDAQFSVNGGATLSRASNTLSESALGIPGLSVTVASTSTETIQVAADTKAMRVKIDDFITKFNEVQEYLDVATKITPDGKGKVTAAILADNREIQDWGRSLRNMAFSAVAGMTGTITRLESLGIDFKAGTNNLEVKDATKLEAALRDKPAEVDAFFHTATTGFAAKFKSFLTTVGTMNTTQQSNLNKSNAGIDTQIADLERRLVQQRSILESAFIAMESAQQKLQSQQAALANAFSSSSSK
ncbi:MAG: flagellar filament capping protein FliD [Opitutaceae bacterium]|nr:flagellar filament capping protein FliD [Opitutaceae bacterium]